MQPDVAYLRLSFWVCFGYDDVKRRVSGPQTTGGNIMDDLMKTILRHLEGCSRQEAEKVLAYILMLERLRAFR